MANSCSLKFHGLAASVEVMNGRRIQGELVSQNPSAPLVHATTDTFARRWQPNDGVAILCLVVT